MLHKKKAAQDLSEDFDANEENARECLICGEPTRYAHMEIDACRACAVFYRRINQKARTQLVCRTGKLACDTKRNGNFCCKRCRYDRFTEVLNEGKKPQAIIASEVENAPSTSSSTSMRCATPPRREVTVPGRSVIADVRRGRSLMNTIRRTSELSTRAFNVANNKGIIVDGMMLIPATYTLLNQATRILVLSMYEFASTAFEEFTTMDPEVQWSLIRNFYPFIAVLDAEYRMWKLLPERETLMMATYASYIDHDTIAHFVSDTPSERNRDDAKRFVANHLNTDVRQMRARMKRWNPTEDEFSAFIGICFWSLDKVNVSEGVLRTAEKYRHLLFLELDKLYRETMHLDEYASRMGEAVLFIETIQGAYSEMRSKLGVLKLLDIIGEEMLFAQLHE